MTTPQTGKKNDRFHSSAVPSLKQVFSLIGRNTDKAKSKAKQNKQKISNQFQSCTRRTLSKVGQWLLEQRHRHHLLMTKLFVHKQYQPNGEHKTLIHHLMKTMASQLDFGSIAKTLF
jgi:hypothetical protein